MDPGSYLDRIGVDPGSVGEPNLPTLARLQREHISAVPFENLAITGDLWDKLDPEGVELSLPVLYEKIVEQERGGYCFELNGLFCWLLRQLGYDARRVAARVLSDGDPGIPANHHGIVVDLDREYLVDVGLGTPKLTRPLALDGGQVPGPTAEWRVVPATRPEEDYRVEIREDGDWQGRYVFTEPARDLGYYQAANDYLQTAPDSPFTGTPHLSIATESGYVKCDGRKLTAVSGSDKSTESLSEREWYDHLEATFGIEIPD